MRTLREHHTDRDRLAAELADCEIVVAMRERTPFDAALLRRLPRLRLLVTTGGATRPSIWTRRPRRA